MRRIPLAILRHTMNDKQHDATLDAPGGEAGQTPQIEPGGLDAPRLASAELKSILEALIFASPEPLTPKQIFKLLDSEPKEDIEAALAALKQDYDRPGGLQLVEVAGGYQ